MIRGNVNNSNKKEYRKCKYAFPVSRQIWRVGVIIGIVLLVFIVLWCLFETKIVYIYHGPYATYTPVDLQIERQKEYNEKLSWGKFIFGGGYCLRAAVVERRDMDYLESWKELFKENKKNSEKVVFSMNSYAWMCLTEGKIVIPGQTHELGDGIILKVIGYKKAERPYYLLRFITHRKGFFPVTENEFVQAKYILNVKEESGSTHVTPEIYLLENCKNSLPSVLWDCKNNMVHELVADKPEGQGRYLIGAISDSEYNELLDPEMKDSLIIRDVMINIPHDPLILVVKDTWSDEEEVCRYLIENGLMEKDTVRVPYLQELYRYYIALGVLRKDEKGNFYIHNPQYENRVKGNGLNILPDSLYDRKDTVSVWCHFYKTIYGNLEDHYYRFEPDTVMKLPVYKEKVVLAEKWKKILQNRIGYRIYIGRDRAGTRIDSLMDRRNNCLYNKSLW